MEEEKLVPYRNLFREMKKHSSQKIQFVSVKLHQMARLSCYLLLPFCLCHQIGKPTPLLSPPQAIQHEDDKDEDLYDDSLPLNE